MRWEHALSTWHVIHDGISWAAGNFDKNNLCRFGSQREAIEYADREGIAAFASLPDWMKVFAFDDPATALANWAAAIGSDKA